MTSHFKPQKLVPQIASVETHREKYAKGDEVFQPPLEALSSNRRRVAIALAAQETDSPFWTEAFFEAQERGVVMAGRINSAAGTDLNATLINCFVQPIADTSTGYLNGVPGIYQALADAGETMRRGGGVGYNFSPLRPRGSLVRGTGSTASGPVSYMHLFDSACKTVESAGARRGAQMGILSISHPDIREFIQAKRMQGVLTQFNMSVAVTRKFMDALAENTPFELVHSAQPSEYQIQNGAIQRDDGMWVYEIVDANEIWQMIMTETYNHAEPGVIFIDRINEQNNLWYAETIEACNPCGEEPLPGFGCCCLGSINLSVYVIYPALKHIPSGNFDWTAFKKDIHVAVRQLDNVLQITHWPLEQQRLEAMNKRRIGLGITGLGSMLALLGLRYDDDQGREIAEVIAITLRNEAYRASIQLAREKGVFPLFDRDLYLQAAFIKSLPEDIRKGIATFGIRNSHLLAIAPTGTISLALCNNCSTGIEPVFSYVYQRNKRMPDGSTKTYDVEDYAFCLYKAHGGDTEALPASFVSALEISPTDHLAMVEVFSKYMDSSISKTVNCPIEMPFESFIDVYKNAYESGLKGVTTYRPNPITGAVLVANNQKPSDLDVSADRKLRLERVPKPALASLRWPQRPECSEGNPSHTYMVKHPTNPFAVSIGHLQNGHAHPFEVWINGQEQPRGLGALAKSLSTDMRTNDFGWLRMKLEALAKTVGTPFVGTLPQCSESVAFTSHVSAFAKLVTFRCEELGVFDRIQETPLIDALISIKEPKSGTDGTLSWTVDIRNPATGDDFAMFVKELVLPDGTHRPFSVWMSGEYPEAFTGICKSLSLDMRIVDPAWIAKKLRSLSNFPEPQGDFMAKQPGSDKQVNHPSTIAYVASLLLHRYRMLGLLDENGLPKVNMGLFKDDPAVSSKQPVASFIGKRCPACSEHSLVKLGGCDTCTRCEYTGSCG